MSISHHRRLPSIGHATSHTSSSSMRRAYLSSCKDRETRESEREEVRSDGNRKHHHSTDTDTVDQRRQTRGSGGAAAVVQAPSAPSSRRFRFSLMKPQPHLKHWPPDFYLPNDPIDRRCGNNLKCPDKFLNFIEINVATDSTRGEKKTLLKCEL